MPGRARDARALEMKPDAGLKVLGWIPKRYCAFSPMPRGRVSSCQALGKMGDWSLELGSPKPLPNLVLRESGPRSRVFPREPASATCVCLQVRESKAMFPLREESPHGRFIRAVLGAQERPRAMGPNSWIIPELPCLRSHIQFALVCRVADSRSQPSAP